MAQRFGFVFLMGLLACVSSTDASDEQRPVSKVMTLLKDMVVQLTKEAQKDQEVMDEMQCWCETGLKEKTAAISSGQDQIGRLTHQIEDYNTRSSKLNVEIANLNKEIGHNTEALSKSTDMRKKEMSEFGEDEKSMLSSIGGMKGAIEAIAAKHEGSFERASSFSRTGARAAFLQQSPRSQENDLTEAIAFVQAQVHQHPKLVNSHQLEVIASFAQAPEESLGKAALLQQGFNPEHTSSSGQIFGVLKGMKETFENDLAGAQRDENKNQGAYESLKKAKDSQITAAQSLAQTKDTELGNVDQRHAEASQNKKDTERTLAADQEFLGNLKEQCKNINAEFFQRTQMRQTETQAVSKALAFLNSDSANDLYARTFKSAAFFQEGMTSAKGRAAAAGVLAKAAAKSHDARLSALASRMLIPIGQEVAATPGAEGTASGAPSAGAQADAFASKREETFDQIKESVQDMVDKLLTEKEDARKHRDFCIDNLQLNERDTDTNNRLKADQGTTIEELAGYIGGLEKEIADLKTQIFESRTIIKRASEDRQSQNTAFQMTVSDQKATKKLLEGALTILKSFYEKAALAQVAAHSKKASQPAGAPPPAGFKSYQKSGTSGGVMGMMQQIIDDAAAMEAEAIKDEEESTVGYETLVNDTNAAIIEMQKQMANKMENKALAHSDKTQTEIENKNTVTELKELRQANIDLHSGCDYALKNFDSKNDARDSEISALKESINIFSGGMGALLQYSKH